jgi:glycogen operon protein
MASSAFLVRPGDRYPPGARVIGDGVNFSIFSRYATAAALALYAGPRDSVPLQVIALDPHEHRTFFFWHVFIEGARSGLYYTWRLDGRDDTAQSGHRFDARHELLDPWARSVSAELWDRPRAIVSKDSAIRARVVDHTGYDWEGDQPLNHSLENSVIYELHVGGFTKHPSSAVEHPGTFRGLIEKIPYLQSLGVTDVELLPVLAFDAQDVPLAAAEAGLSNFWGYSPYGFFAPHPAYVASGDGIDEFRDMVKALHRAGIGVILDVVLNHTAEGGPDGPVIGFKGFGNEFFYHLDPEDKNLYRDYTGCGNTINCNHPLVARFLLQCLEYWVGEMHVDGFRLDLASVLARGEDGEPMYHAPVLWSIEFSRVLARSKLIAEAWDAVGLYQVGDFPGFRWAEWNGQYRDALRRFVRGDGGVLPEVSARLCGSSDLYAPSGRLPINSVNFITCHDGFTLIDLLSYAEKHNEDNGEDNLDGIEENYSANCGVEGPTNDPSVTELRYRQARNLIALLLLSQGVPMLLAGDEVLRSQKGNNNAYCQDNSVSWLDWTLTERNAGMLRFTREMIAFRKRHSSLRRTRFLTGIPAREGAQPDIVWYGASLDALDWTDSEARVLAFTLAGVADGEEDLHVMINMSDREHILRVPALAGRPWHRAVDTAEASPRDILSPEHQPPAAGPYAVAARAIVVLEARG